MNDHHQMTNPDFETTIVKNNQDIYIELYDIEYCFHEGDPRVGWPDEWEIISYESKVFIGDEEVINEQVKESYLDALDEDDISNKMIPVWEENRLESINR